MVMHTVVGVIFILLAVICFLVYTTCFHCARRLNELLRDQRELAHRVDCLGDCLQDAITSRDDTVLVSGKYIDWSRFHAG